MSTSRSASVLDLNKRPPPGSRFDRALALTDVILAFMAVHVTFRAIKHFTVVGQWKSGRNFTPGVVMIVFTIAVLLLCGRSFEAYALGLKRWSYHLSLGLVMQRVADCDRRSRPDAHPVSFRCEQTT